MARKFLYLDVDGVLLGKNDPRDMRFVLARHVLEFLKARKYYYPGNM